jgi:hypothetical protein
MRATGKEDNKGQGRGQGGLCDPGHVVNIIASGDERLKVSSKVA